MYRGKLKWFDHKKGYGFIIPDAGGPDVFVHISAMQAGGIDDPEENMRLSYQTEINKRSKKTCACNVKAI